MKKKSESQEITDVAVVEKENSLAQVAPSVFKDVDFSGLNDAIDALGDASADLDKDQRMYAISIIDDWRNNVVERLRNHAEEMRNMMDFFRGIKYFGNHAGYFTDNELAALATKTETEGLYEEYLSLLNEKNALKAAEPEKPEMTDDITALEFTRLDSAYQYDIRVYRNRFSKLERKTSLAYTDWLTALNNNEEVKAMISKAQAYLRNLAKLTNDCDSKTNLAKLNVKIGSKSVRESLRSLLEFTTSL